MSTGNIVEIIGAVVDVEFPRESVPKVYEALTVSDTGLTLEVQQQLGDGVVRTIAMGSSDGLKRGIEVNNTGSPITVPVGEAALGRILDVLGQPVDEAGPIKSEHHLPIHRSAPSYAEQTPTVEILETGIKVIDLIMLPEGLLGAASKGRLHEPQALASPSLAFHFDPEDPLLDPYHRRCLPLGGRCPR